MHEEQKLPALDSAECNCIPFEAIYIPVPWGVWFRAQVST